MMWILSCPHLGEVPVTGLRLCAEATWIKPSIDGDASELLFSSKYSLSNLQLLRHHVEYMQTPAHEMPEYTHKQTTERGRRLDEMKLCVSGGVPVS